MYYTAQNQHLFAAWVKSNPKLEPFPHILSVFVYTDSLAKDSVRVDSAVFMLAKKMKKPGAGYDTSESTSITAKLKEKTKLPYLIFPSSMDEYAKLRPAHSTKSKPFYICEEDDNYSDFHVKAQYTDKKGVLWCQVSFDLTEKSIPSFYKIRTAPEKIGRLDKSNSSFCFH